ncbi:MAG: alpha-rhamnosidase [Paludibacter sp.]|nr:alpha-rhamnosidase [Paludibacter sp.]
MKKSVGLICLIILIASSAAIGQTEQVAKWIAYPGEFGIWTHKELMSRRTERNVPVPTSLARIDAPYGIIRFTKRIKLDKPERASLYADGKFYIRGIDGGGIMYDYDPQDFELPAGDYTLFVLVENYRTMPAIYFKSESYVSDGSWVVSSLNEDRVSAEVLPFADPTLPPSTYKLAVAPIRATIVDKGANHVLYDFGKETFAFPVLQGLKGKGKINIYYGESKEEALAGKLAETWDELNVESLVAYNDTLPTKAFRYVQIITQEQVGYQDFLALYEYLPVNYRGSFKCSDDLLNRIYDFSYYTLHLCTREVHIDGIKRDRWAWSGDAYQSYLMNFYTFFDEDVNKRTLWGLRGHEPQTRHINSILDYSFYWMIGIYNHYMYTGDAEFVKAIYPRMKSTMDFCVGRLNKSGIAEGLPTDWVFVDWAPIEKKGELSFEQLLFIRSLVAMKSCATIANDKLTAEKMERMYDAKAKQFDELFWSDSKGAYAHNRLNGALSSHVTRYSNMFAVLFNMVDETRKKQIKNNVLLNDSILAITTPYMKFYELAALCEIGEQEKVLDFVRRYWGGMLKLGATSVWETFDPALPDTAHYSMYNRPFGKSLCHAWGGNPVYLFGRYYLGVYPTAPAYNEYVVEPDLGGLKWMEGTVPTPDGEIKVWVTPKTITVRTAKSTGGVLIFTSGKKPEISAGVLKDTGNGQYRLELNKANETFTVKIK